MEKHNKLILTDHRFYKSFFLLCLPIMLQNMISLGVNLADNLMLGRFSEAALSGVTAVNQIQFVYAQLINGCGEAMVILASQYWGKKEIDPIRRIASISMRSGLTVMLLLFLFTSFFPRQAMLLFTNDEALIATGMEYLRIIKFTYPFFCVTTILLCMLQATQVVRIALTLSCSTLIINCCINYTLIYGNFGMPRLGVTGAAIGTLTARVVELLILLWFLHKKEQNIHIKLKDFFHVDKLLTKDFFKVGTPVLILKLMWGCNTAMQTVILGHLSSAAIAANSMASNLYLLIKTMATGEASATNVIIGKTIGEGKSEDELRLCSRSLQMVFLIIGVFSSLLMFVLSEPILSLYSFSEESRYLARAFLRILCVVMLFMCYQMPVNTGIIKGGGDTQFVVKLDIVCIWSIAIPAALLAAFVFNASPIVVVFCLNLDQFCKSIPSGIHVNRGHWMKKLTR